MQKLLNKPTTSLNPYESFRDIHRDSDWYNAERWNKAALNGNLAMEADIIARADNEIGNYADFVDKWHLDRASEDIYYAAVTRELYADKTIRKNYEEEVWNEDTQSYETKKYNMTEYDWMGHQLQKWVDYDNAQIQKELEEERKKNRSWIAKVGAGLVDFGTAVIHGFIDTVNSISNFATGIFNASMDAIFDHKNWLKQFRKYMAYEDQGLRNIKELRGDDFFADWSILRNTDGSYTTLGNYLTGAAYTIGQMAPSMLGNAFLPFVGGSIAGGAMTAGATKAIYFGNTAAYYTAMWSSRTGERFRNPDFASTPTWLILLDSTLKTTTDILIEQGLRMFTGGSTTDRLLFGSGVKGSGRFSKVAGSKLGTLGRVGYRLAKDFVLEGTEEVLQDVFANISSQIEGMFYDSFNTDEITFQSLLDTFLISGITSLFMTGIDIAFTQNMEFSSEEGSRKLGKVKSWLYLSDYNELANKYQELLNNKDLTPDERVRIMESMSNTFNTLITVFRELGPERLQKAQNLITKVREHYDNVQKRIDSINVLSNEERLRTIGESQDPNARYTAYANAVFESLNSLGNDFAKSKITKKSLFQRIKNKDGTTKNQSVAEKLAEAEVTQIHDFISKTDINDVTPQKGRSQKRVNLAKKIAKELNKDVAYTDGRNTVNAGEVQMIPGNYADTHEDIEVLRTIVENEFVDVLTAKLDRKLLNKIRNWYRAVQKDKVRGTYEQAVRQLLFDDNFFAVCFASADQDMYQFITHIRAVLSEAKGNKVSDAMYEKVIQDVLDRYKPIIRDYVINQQNADLGQLQDFFTEEEIREITKQRWSFDLTNRILNNNTYDKLTEADERIIESRINYLATDNGIKEQIRKDIKSSSVNVRMRALMLLDAQYKNMFFSEYNDRVYFEPTTPARAYFNQMMQRYNINLIHIRSGKYPQTFLQAMSKVIDENGNPYKDPILFLQKQFEQYTENGYAFTITGNNIDVFPTNVKTNYVYTTGSLEYYNDNFGMMQQAMREQIGASIVPSRNIELMNKAMKDIVDGSKVDNINLAYTSINDVIQRPYDYLKGEDLADIHEDYDEVNNYTTFQYLREKLLDKYETITLIRRTNGQVVFADITDAYDSLVDSVKNADRNTNSIFEKYVDKGPISITKFINKKNLDPALEDYKIVFTHNKNKSAGLHDPANKIIYVYSSKNNAFTKFTILHEFQHAIQNVNNLAGGLSPYFYVSDELLADFEKNLPELFGKNASVETKKDNIRWYLYKTANGELDADLFGDTIVFMGTLVTGTKGNLTHIVTPWGTEHDIIIKDQGQNLELPDYNTNEILTIIDKNKYPKFYKAIETLIDKQDIDYEYAEQMTQLRSDILNVSEVNDYYNQALGKKAIPESVKKKLFERINRDKHLYNQMLELMWYNTVPAISYQEFLDMDIPFVRIQNQKNVGNTIGSSVLIGEDALDALMRYTSSGIAVNLYVGTFKPKEILAYIPGETINEAFLNYDKVKNAERFTIVKDHGKIYVVQDEKSITKADTWYDGKIHLGETFTSDMQQRVKELDTQLQEEVNKGKARVYDGTLENGEALWILPNGSAYVIINFRDGVRTEYYLDFVIEAFCFNDNITINLPLHITTDAYNQLNMIANKLRKSNPVTVSVGHLTEFNDIAPVNNVVLSNDAPVSTQIQSLVSLYNNISERDFAITRNQELLEYNEDQPAQEEKVRKAKVRRTTSKRGAKPRINSDRTYVSKAASKGTNLAPFAGRRIPLDMQGFINEASPTRLPGELWEKIENGTLNYYDVHRYFRTHHDLDDYTFQLIRKYFFPNAWFKTNQELVKFTDLDLAMYYALQGVLYEAGFDVDVNKPMSFDNFMKLYEQISQNPSFKDRLDTKVLHFSEVKVFNKKTKTYEYEALDIDENHLRVAAMELMDGSIDSAAHVIALARAIAMSYKYKEIWNTADRITAKSLQDTTTGHKADDADSGTFEDIVADVRTSKDMMTQALEDKIAESNSAKKLELIYEYYGDKIKRKNPDYKNWSNQMQLKAMRAIQKKVSSMTDVEIENLYRKLIAKQFGVNFTESAIENKKVAVPVDRRKNIIASIKGFATRIKNYRSVEQWKNVPDEYKQYFNEDGNLKSEVYDHVELKPDENGNYPKLQEVQLKLSALATGLRNGDFRTKTATNAFKQAQKYKQLYTKQKQTNQKLKNRYALVSDNKNLIIQSNSREFKANANIAMPDKLRIMFDTQFDNTRQSTIKFIAKPDDKSQVFNAKTFYDVNADILSNLTKDDVEEIIRFYDSAVLLEADEASIDKFKVFKIYLLAYFIDEARSGRWNIDSYYLERADDLLHSVTTSARELAAWRSVLGKVNPNKVIMQALATRLGVELDESDVDNLVEATKTGDVRKILKAQRELMRNTLYRYKTVGDTPAKNTRAVNKVKNKLFGTTDVNITDAMNNPEKYFSKEQLDVIHKEYGTTKQDTFAYIQDFVLNKTAEVALINKDGNYIFVDMKSTKSGFMNKLITFQKAMMLSSPATALRNQISNTFIERGNKLAEVFGSGFGKIISKTDNWIRKLIKRPHGDLAIEQLDIIGVKVTDDVKDFIQKQIIDAGVFEFISDGASKYDTRKSRTYTGMDALTDMVVNKIINDITRGNAYNHDVMNVLVQQIFSWQSDNRFINRTAKRYLGKLLTAQKVDLTRGLSEEVMTNIAEAYKLAAFDYMHKNNVITELENKLRERAPKIYAGYKLIFPFMPSAWNWFVESINWSPVGLVKNIVQLCRLEKTVDKILLDRQKGRQTYDPRLVKYVLTRNVGKGVAGSLLMGLGMLLGGLGVIEVDDDDDKLKIKINDIYFNISNIFGSSSIILGAELMNPRDGGVFEVLEAAFGAITEDAWLNDIAEMFSYGADSVWDVLLDKPTDILGTFVPNFLKSLNKLLYSHEIKYDSGILGNLEYLAASSIPFLAHAFPKKIDPFTGEVQSKYGLSFGLDFLTDLINIASPIQVKPHKVSEQEKIAIELGLNKQPLKGEYDDIGKVDYTTLNMKYGSLNQQDLIKLINNQIKYTVEDEDGERHELYWRQMSKEQKKTVVERIMSNNSRYAKIYAWTQAGHKYYASNSMYKTLKNLGITKNIFKGDKGFVA